MELFAGFDLGGTYLKYGVIDTFGRMLQEDTAATPENLKGLFISLEAIWNKIQNRPRSRMKGAGFGFPGIFHSAEQKIIQSPNYPPIEGHALFPALKKFVDVPFFLDNEANFAAYGEYRAGAGKETKSLVLLTIGTGIGAGIVFDGRLWKGACGFAGELGHVTVNPHGEPCRCGNQGCLETEVSAQKIVRSYHEFSQSREHLTTDEIARRAANKDEAALKALSRAGFFLGIGLSMVINFLNPAKILLGGGVMESGECLLPSALKEARRRSFAAAYECCSIERTKLGNKAGFIGAALWARDQIIEPRG